MPVPVTRPAKASFLSGFVLRGLFMTGCIAALMLLWGAINPAPSADGQRAITLFERARDSVVSISTRQYVEDVCTRNVFAVPQGTGSGIIWDEAG